MGQIFGPDVRLLCLQLLHLPVEVKIKDLVRIGVVDEFELGDPPKNIAKRLQKEGLVERFNQKSGIFTLQRMSNNDCYYLDRKSRLCTIYDKRPDTCRNHPKIGPRPGIARTSRKKSSGCRIRGRSRSSDLS